MADIEKLKEKVKVDLYGENPGHLMLMKATAEEVIDYLHTHGFLTAQGEEKPVAWQVFVNDYWVLTAQSEASRDECMKINPNATMRPLYASPPTDDLEALLTKAIKAGFCVEIKAPWAGGVAIDMFKMKRDAKGHSADGFAYSEGRAKTYIEYAATATLGLRAALEKAGVG